MTGENLTIADISIATTLTMPTLLDEDGEYTRYPKIASWLAKIHSTEEWINHFDDILTQLYKSNCRATSVLIIDTLTGSRYIGL